MPEASGPTSPRAIAGSMPASKQAALPAEEQILTAPPGQRSGMGLALSGGGFRASLFGLGTLWRMNELGWLKSLHRITSVSGGSLTAGVLAARWGELEFDSTGRATNFEAIVVSRLRAFCTTTLDWKAGLCALIPLVTAAGVTRRAYDRRLVKDSHGRIARLADLPPPGVGPDFVFYATCFQTGSSFRFSREGLYDWKLGTLRELDISLGTALAASAGFPPFLSPLRLRTDPRKWGDKSHLRGLEHADRIRARLFLGDGGVYDNMGIEALWRNMACVLVSDAGAPFAFQRSPWRNWPGQLGRVRDILIDQTRALRKRMLIRDLQTKTYEGAYWGINTLIGEYTATPPMCTDGATTQSLAHIGTRLRAMDHRTQQRLINWGYALADAAIRTHVDTTVTCGQFPYPESGFS